MANTEAETDGTCGTDASDEASSARDALQWLASQLRWEQKLGALRSHEDSEHPKAA